MSVLKIVLEPISTILAGLLRTHGVSAGIS
jgi:hypothetical protein